MLVKILGGIDVIIGVVLIFLSSLSLSKNLLIVFGMIMVAKSLLGFFKDFASWVDVCAGGIFLLTIIISIPQIISIIVGILVLQKGIFSFL